MSKEVKRYDAFKYEALRDAAKKATPGPWRMEDDEDSAAGAMYIRQDTPEWREPIARLYGWHDQNYLEVADPTTILELLAERDALLAERDRLRDALEQIENATWSSSETATDFAISQAKGFLIGKLKRIASSALQGAQP